MSLVTDTNICELPLSLPKYKLYRRRFYVLFVFSFLAFNQCLFWITFSPISTSTETYYSISEGTVDLLLAWGPIFFIPCLPLAYLLLNKRNGLRYCVIVLAIIDLLATIIRIIPSTIISSTNPHYSSIALPFLHVGQILNALCGPLAMVPVSQLSCLWFGVNERTRATTVAIMSYNLGSTIGFVMAPSVVYSPELLPNLLYIHAGLALAACIFTLAYFPGQPPIPPSPAAKLLMNPPITKQNVKPWKSFTNSLGECFTTRSFILLVCAGGLIGGTFGAWTSLFDTILNPEHYTEEQSGWFGFSSSLAEITGGLCLSFLADMPRFNRSFKAMIVISFSCYFLSVLWFNLSIHTLFSDKSILPSNAYTIGISVTLAGLFQGAASPVTYEALAEILYPLPESLSASILVELINITSLILFFIAPDRSELMNFVIIIVIGTCVILVAATKFHYKRRDADNVKRNSLVLEDNDPASNSNEIESTEDISQMDPPIDSIQMEPLQNFSFTNPMQDLQIHKNFSNE